MVDRLAELGALQYAAANTATASVNPSRIAASGYIHAMYAEYVTWSLANPGVNPSRLSAKGRIFGYFYDNATFSPLSLFASGEQGAWYDPSDLTTMFQDAAGTIPVTADGQPVGLILDKSKGLVLGPELVTNTGPFTATTGWGDQQGNAPLSVSAGNLLATPTNTAVCRTDTQISTVVGKWYSLSITVNQFSGIGQTVAILSSRGGVPVSGTGTVGTVGVNKIIFLASTTSVWLTVGSNISTIGIATIISSATVKELPGNHATQATAASRPLKTSTGAAYWTNYDAVDDVLNTTFPSSLGSSCTVCRANVGAAPTILTAQTIGTSYADSTDNAGLIIINRALTGQETTDVTAWLLAKGATA